MDKLEVVKIKVKPVNYMGCPDDKCKRGVDKETGDPKCNHGLGLIERSFETYSVVDTNDNWYDLKGWGTYKVKEGDTIYGEFVERPWTSKDGKTGTSIDFVIAKPEASVEVAKAELAEAKAEIERLKGFDGKPAVGEIDPDYIPF